MTAVQAAVFACTEWRLTQITAPLMCFTAIETSLANALTTLVKRELRVRPILKGARDSSDEPMRPSLPAFQLPQVDVLLDTNIYGERQ